MRRSADDLRAWVFGEEGADYAAADNLAGLQTFENWVEKGWISADANGLDYDQAWQEFAEGDGVFLPAGSWLTAGLRERMGDNVGFFAPPPGDSGKVVGRGRQLAAAPHLQQVREPRPGRGVHRLRA